MAYAVSDIASVIKAVSRIVYDEPIAHLLIDSRKIVFPSASLFFALSGPRRDGHDFIPEVYERGVRCFVVKEGFATERYPDASFLFVPDVLQALQVLAAYHRSQFQVPVIGITGSNGKTIVKEWLNQLLQPEYSIVRSPRSYNSQVGVPLSVWQMDASHTLGIFEAGISMKGEMPQLEKIIQPTIGVFTNIGEAHSEGFENDDEKATEKSKLFVHAQPIIYYSDNEPLSKAIAGLGKEAFSWSRKKQATVVVASEEKTAIQTSLVLTYQGQQHPILLPFTDTASIDNAITCCCVLLQLGYAIPVIQQRIAQLQPIEMRMQLKKAINNCYLLNDSYSNDISSLSIALDYLQQQAGNSNTTVILSDILQSGLSGELLYTQVAKELAQRQIYRLIGIGPQLGNYQALFAGSAVQTAFYASTESFLEQASFNHFREEYILLKGARVFAFERISHWLEQKVHQTIMEINLSAMVHNLKVYQQYLLPTTCVMAMVKAFSYGSGSVEVARILQFCKVDYLAVAYADEGIELRKSGISLPIMVMNADEASFDALIEHDLEPEIYSFGIYQAFHQYLLQQGISQFPVHIKINTGMNRLGFEVSDMAAVADLLLHQHTVVVKSVFSHLVASEDPAQDDFTLHQASLFEEACVVLQRALPYTFLRHIDNSSGISRHPSLQYDMVRLGIGLYGVDSAQQLPLETVATVKSTIAQLRNVKATETVSYNRRGVLYRDSLIATIRIGYADGFSRRLGNRRGSMYVNGMLAPVIGTVCMDMVMIDVTDVPGVKEGDSVEIFGKHLPVQQVAAWCDTIPYEIMTSINQRVKRIYVEE